MRVHDASEFLEKIEITIAALSHDWQLPRRKGRMRCRFCGIGTYKRSDSFPIVGNLQTGYDRNYLVCDHCGHVESFIWPPHQPPPAWDESN